MPAEWCPFYTDEENERYKNHKTNNKKATKKKTKRKFVTSATTEVVAQYGQNSSAVIYYTIWLIPPTAIMNDTQELFLQDLYDFILPSLW